MTRWILKLLPLSETDISAGVRITINVIAPRISWLFDGSRIIISLSFTSSLHTAHAPPMHLMHFTAESSLGLPISYTLDLLGSQQR